jgi:hypothetical protein
MRCLPFKIIIFLSLSICIFAQSPHGVNFSYDCELCHEPTSWKIDLKKVEFDHSITKFELAGQHKAADCRSCHTSLEFSKINSDCISCHTDLHQGTVGNDCSKCHTSKTWMVEDINGLHQKGRFPLVGNHLTADCQSCHPRYVDLYFESLNSDCYSCHSENYNSTQNPNHVTAGFSTNCQDCHSITASEWTASNIAHDFFPLVGGHEFSNCFACHEQGGNFTGLSPECVSCHLDNYNATANPNHIAAGFPTECIQCHTIMGWTPATFDHDALFFPIYNGKHKGEWNQCSDCHEVPNNYSVFTCISCHEHNQQEMDDEHQGVQGYIYASNACLSCHPDGKKGNAFNHVNSNFPLTGAHISLNCQDCHSSGYQGTPTECFACHQLHFNNTTNPSHIQLVLSTECTYCHTTEPDWKPALFPVHNQYYELLGRHLEIANDCNSCHNGNYVTTPNLCYDCHTDAYNNAQNPNHTAAGIPAQCEDCHTSSAWIPSTFSHTLTGFELLGAHFTIQCSGCHVGTTGGLNSECISCHQDDYNTAPNHVAQGFPTNCEMCHNSIAWSQVTFDHNATSFPLTGAHISVNCFDCHESGFSGTSTICYDCHQQNYQQSTNPSHTALSLPTDCEQCHTTNPDWQPATFPIHNQYYQLIGAHANITDCGDCHNGNYNNTPNTCIGCHQNDYNGTTNPPHQLFNFSYDCLQCHNMNGWIPASFNHSFYPISNDHNNVSCNECHSEPNYQPQCLSCHWEDFLDEHEPGDPTNCWECHDTFDWDDSPKLPGIPRNL